MTKKITAIIPARGGSKGILNKNIVDVCGHPLVAYTISLCLKCNNIADVYVSTDSLEIANIAKSYGAQIINRPKELAMDHSTDDGFLNHFFDLVDVDEVALMRPTTPLRNKKYVDETIEEYYANREKVTSLRSVNETNESPYKVYRIENNLCKGFFKDFRGISDYSNLPRQTFPKTFQGNGHIDVVKRATLKSGSTYGEKIYAKVGSKVTDIDCQFDLDILRLQINGPSDQITKILEEQ